MQLQDLNLYIQEALSSVIAEPIQRRAEAFRLLESIQGVTPELIYRDPEYVVSSAELERLQFLLKRRIQDRVPIQYLLGVADFFGLRLNVTPAVLIPRPETELLVEQALALFPWDDPSILVVDACTGSGVIALALAHKTQWQIIATELSSAAIVVAKHNAAQLNLPQIDFRPGDLLEPLRGEKVHLLISNPPYIDPALRPTLEPEVLHHEPAMALFPSKGVLEFYERIVLSIPQTLHPGGHVILELGSGMGSAVLGCFDRLTFSSLQILNDWAGHERMLLGKNFQWL